MLDFIRTLFMPYEERMRLIEEAYLNGATDNNDLEWRQRQIDRGVLRKQMSMY